MGFGDITIQVCYNKEIPEARTYQESVSIYLTVLEAESPNQRLWKGSLTVPHLGRCVVMRVPAGNGNPIARQEDTEIQGSGPLWTATSYKNQVRILGELPECFLRLELPTNWALLTSQLRTKALAGIYPLGTRHVLTLAGITAGIEEGAVSAICRCLPLAYLVQMKSMNVTIYEVHMLCEGEDTVGPPN